MATIPVQYSATVTETAIYPKEDMTALVETAFDIAKSSSGMIFPS